MIQHVLLLLTREEKTKTLFSFAFSVTSAYNKVFRGLASWLNWGVWSWWDQIAVVGFELCFINSYFYFEQLLMQSSWEVFFFFIGIAQIKCPFMTDILEIGVLRNCTCIYNSRWVWKQQIYNRSGNSKTGHIYTSLYVYQSIGLLSFHLHLAT